MAGLAIAESRAMTKRVLFIDGDNHIWSRFCEELFNHLAASRRASWVAFSRASASTPSLRNLGPMSPVAIEALRHRGVRSLNALRLPLEVTNFDFVVADLAIALEEPRDRPVLATRWTTFEPTVRYWPAHDAWPEPTAALARLDRLVRELVAEITELTRRAG